MTLFTGKYWTLINKFSISYSSRRYVPGGTQKDRMKALLSAGTES